MSIRSRAGWSGMCKVSVHAFGILKDALLDAP